MRSRAGLEQEDRQDASARKPARTSLSQQTSWSRTRRSRPRGSSDFVLWVMRRTLLDKATAGTAWLSVWGAESGSHAARLYSWISPTSRSCRSTRSDRDGVAARIGWPLLVGRHEVERSMWAVAVVMVDEDPEHSIRMAAVEDQQPVETLGSDGADEAFGDRVGLRRSHRCADGPRQIRLLHDTQRPRRDPVACAFRRKADHAPKSGVARVGTFARPNEACDLNPVAVRFGPVVRGRSLIASTTAGRFGRHEHRSPALYVLAHLFDESKAIPASESDFDHVKDAGDTAPTREGHLA